VTADPSSAFAANTVGALATLDETTVEFARTHAALAKVLKAEAMGRLRKAIAAARKARLEEPADPDDDAASAPVYVEDSDSTYIATSDGKRRLSTFVARIDRVLVRDDGQATEHECVVSGRTSAGPLPSLTVPGRSFGDVAAWVRDSPWLGVARVEAGRDVASHLAAAIERASTPERTIVYAHTGWREISGRRVYLMPEHLEGVTVALDGVGGRYHLPPPPTLAGNTELQRAVRFSLDLADGWTPNGSSLPLVVLAPVMGAVYTAPLSSALAVDFVVWIPGTSGQCKSGLSAVAMSHFGEFNYNSLPLAWTSTANRIELALFHLKDVLVVIDDYKADLPGVGPAAARIVQQVGNRADRGRLNRNSGAMASRPPRGLVVSTGEELPSSVSDSTPGRLVVVRVDAGMLRKAAIIDCMSAAPRYRLAMSGYTTWLGQDPARMVAAVATRDALANEFEETLGSGVHARAARNLATLAAGFRTFMTFALDLGAVDTAEAERRQQWVSEALTRVGRAQAEATAGTSPVDRYVTTVCALLQNGARTLARRDEPLTKADIGWDDPDGGRVYLDHDLAWHAVAAWHREETKAWPYNPTSLRRGLVDRGLAREGKDPTHPGLHRVRVGGRTRTPTWVLDLDRTVIEHALPGEPAGVVAARRAAAEAEAEDAVAVLNRELPN
jgi:DNA polymerase-1